MKFIILAAFCMIADGQTLGGSFPSGQFGGSFPSGQFANGMQGSGLSPGSYGQGQGQGYVDVTVSAIEKQIQELILSVPQQFRPHAQRLFGPIMAQLTRAAHMMNRQMFNQGQGQGQGQGFNLPFNPNMNQRPNFNRNPMENLNGMNPLNGVNPMNGMNSQMNLPNFRRPMNQTGGRYNYDFSETIESHDDNSKSESKSSDNQGESFFSKAISSITSLTGSSADEAKNTTVEVTTPVHSAESVSPSSNVTMTDGEEDDDDVEVNVRRHGRGGGRGHRG